MRGRVNTLRIIKCDYAQARALVVAWAEALQSSVSARRRAPEASALWRVRHKWRNKRACEWIRLGRLERGESRVSSVCVGASERDEFVRLHAAPTHRACGGRRRLRVAILLLFNAPLGSGRCGAVRGGFTVISAHSASAFVRRRRGKVSGVRVAARRCDELKL